MARKQGWKHSTLDSVNRALRDSGLTQFTAAKDPKHQYSFVLRFDDDVVTPEEIKKAQGVVSDLMGPTGWGEARRIEQ